jgi:hypothetical protein
VLAPAPARGYLLGTFTRGVEFPAGKRWIFREADQADYFEGEDE